MTAKSAPINPTVTHPVVTIIGNKLSDRKDAGEDPSSILVALSFTYDDPLSIGVVYNQRGARLLLSGVFNCMKGVNVEEPRTTT